jgi:uncharacterized protein (TIGR03437 family)
MPIVNPGTSSGTADSTSGSSNALAPAIRAEGMTNAASYAGGAVSPGEIAVLFGATSGPKSLQMGSASGVRVLFDGVPGHVLYGAPGQTAAIVPFGVSGKASTQVQYEFQGVRSNTVAMQVKSATPGVFTLDASGKGAAAVLDSANRVISTDNPVRRGDTLQLFATGGGTTATPIVDGLTTGAIPLSQKVTASIGGVDCPITYAGTAPGMVAGAVQINFQVPSGVPSGVQPVTITIGGVSSQTSATLQVQ